MRQSTTPSTASGMVSIDHAVLATLSRRQSMPIPTLYRLLVEGWDGLASNITIGTFHDSLRRLQASRQIQLLPFTQALYELEAPEFALFVGREIRYYVEKY